VFVENKETNEELRTLNNQLKDTLHQEMLNYEAFKREKEHIIAEKDAIIEEKNKEIALLRNSTVEGLSEIALSNNLLYYLFLKVIINGHLHSDMQNGLSTLRESLIMASSLSTEELSSGRRLTVARKSAPREVNMVKLHEHHETMVSVKALESAISYGLSENTDS
jgi:hypothetical protein